MKSTSSTNTRNAEKNPSDEEAFEAWKLLERYRAKIVSPISGEPDALIRIEDAAKHAATSVRVIREAWRAGDLPLFGKQRDRSVRRDDLQKWIESRRSKPVEGPWNKSIEARMHRIEAARKAASR